MSEEVGVARELGGVLEGEAGTALAVAGHDQGGDVDELAVAAGGGAGLPPGPAGVVARRRSVAPLDRGEGEHGVLDGARRGRTRRRRGGDRWRHGPRVRPAADARLTPD